MSWNEEGISATSLQFVTGVRGEQQLTLSGTWRSDGEGRLQVGAANLSLDTLLGQPGGPPARYGGTLNLDATIRGTRAAPIVTGTVAIVNGRVRRLSYEKLAGRVDYADNLFRVDLRLDQAPGVWLTATGSVPHSFLDRSLPEQPIHVTFMSSAVSLGLLEGITDRVRDVAGEVRMNVTALGTSGDPHFEGTVEVANAGFTVAATGARYRNGAASLALAPDRVMVTSFHLEDRNGQPLEVSGTLGTHELKLETVQIDVRARRFEVLNNEIGNMDVDAALSLRQIDGRPSVDGDVTIVSGELSVDEILAQALFQPYSTQAAPAPEVDAVAVLNPWDLVHIDVALHSRGTLRMLGQDTQVTSSNPLGLGSFNLRATGDLYIYKDPGQPMYVNGSFDSVTGSYAFQGRRFEMDPTSSINFKGDLNPEVYVTVARVISGVEARVTISGTLTQPELRLASTPPLESSDILSLIVFNVSMNELSVAQQRELAVRAGTLAAGFVATPLVSALQRSLGLETLEIEAPDALSTGPRVTVGSEIAPGLVAEFTRQFGQQPYSQAAIEYYISRFLRLRATFSDAETLVSRSAFRRTERAGIDLLLFFSF
jgi:autotransporter translocation and assembly factor TamB